jgi:two-component system cell cycle sensor histidine kinase/response regulator CckA
VGEGTTFRIHLPRTEPAPDGDDAASAAPHRPVAAAPAAATAAATAVSTSILLVEDEAPLRRLTSRVLEQAGHRVTVADSAESALEALENGPMERPRALVSDVAMPGIDGLSLARQLRQRWPDLPVLLLSGYAEVMLGADLDGDRMAFLPKPFAPSALTEAVERLLAGVPAATED